MPGSRAVREEEEQEDPTMEMEESEESEDEDDSPLPVKFRNYIPVDDRLKKYVLEQPPLPNIVEEIDLKLTQVIAANTTRDILNLAPKKANWDLKRDLAKKIELLERKTQRAITNIVLEKFQQDSNQSLEKKVDTLYHAGM